MRAKQLSKLLSGKVYLGGSSTKRPAPEQKGLKQCLKKKINVRAQSAIKDNDDDNDLPPPPAKEGRSAVKE